MSQPISAAPARPCPLATSVAFAEFYAQHEPHVRRYCAFRFGADVADELTAHVMERALQCFDDLDRQRDPWAWLAVVARNAGLNAVRASQQCAPVEFAKLADLPAQRWADPAEAWDQHEQRVLLSAALARIPAGQRRVLMLRLYEELDFASIADLLGTTENAVRQQLFKARKAFAAAYRSLSGGAAAVTPLPLLLALARRLLRSSDKRSDKASLTATGSVGALAAVTLGVALHLATIGPLAPATDDVQLNTSDGVVQTSLTVAHRIVPTPPRLVVAAAAVAVRRPPVVPTVTAALPVQAKIADDPLAAGEAIVVSAQVRTDHGTFSFYHRVSSDRVGPACRAVPGLCG